MKIRYRLSLRNQFYSLSFIIALTIAIIFGGVYFYNNFGYIEGTPLVIGIFFYLVYFLPVCYLHIEYFVNDYKKTLYIDYGDNLFVYVEKHDRQVFHLDDIEKITIYKDDNGWFSTSTYSFVSIQIKEREKPIILTSFLIREFAIPLRIKNQKIFHKRRIIPSPFFERYL
jgi:hypothetical protein